MARIHDVVFDCGHPASLARFWASILDGYAVAPYDDAELERLAGLGIYSTEDDPGVIVDGPPGAPRLYFHPGRLDLVVVTTQVEVDAVLDLLRLGHQQGNEFCITW